MPRWGPRSPVKIHWPEAHRAEYEAQAEALGLSFNEFVIRAMRDRVPFPPAHLERYEQMAAASGLSLTEFIVRAMAERFDLPAEPHEKSGQQQLRLGA